MEILTLRRGKKNQKNGISVANDLRGQTFYWVVMRHGQGLIVTGLNVSRA